MNENKILIIGAGFSGAVVASRLADNGYQVDVVDSRHHIAGNCFTEKDEKTGVMVHRYGPHIFHTDNDEVWDFITRFGELKPYTNRVKAVTGGAVYSLPINLHTINQYFNKALSPSEAKKFISSLGDDTIDTPVTFEQQALKFIGKDIYKAFFEGYTKKQWGVNPSELPASILKRLPVRFTYDDNYFNHKHQGIPLHGYTSIVEAMLDHPNISVALNSKLSREQVSGYEHVFYCGPIDEWFGCSEGQLGYRTLDFEEIRCAGDYQGCAVMNYCDEEVPYTRITEHKYFEPWNKNKNTVAFKESSRQCEVGDIPYYPIRLVKEKKLLTQYVDMAKNEKDISFIGRLGTYRYLDMDVTIAEALLAADTFLQCKKKGDVVPAFFVDVG